MNTLAWVALAGVMCLWGATFVATLITGALSGRRPELVFACIAVEFAATLAAAMVVVGLGTHWQWN